jgi:F0F1-type ATP synthase membrane subunit b/b'
MITENILLIGQLSAAITAVITLVAIVIKYALLKPIQNYIDKATYQIQPHANGGKSLADVARSVNHIKGQLEGLHQRVEAIEANTCKKPQPTLKTTSKRRKS